MNRLAAQRSQHDGLLPTRRPALDFGPRAGLAASRATRSFRRPRRIPTCTLLLRHFQFPFSDTLFPQIRVQKNRGRFNLNFQPRPPHPKKSNAEVFTEEKLRCRQIALLGDRIDIVGKRQRHDVRLESVDYRPRLLARAAVRLPDEDVAAALGLCLPGEGGVEFLVQLARRIIRIVEQRDFGTNRLNGDCSGKQRCEQSDLVRHDDRQFCN